MERYVGLDVHASSCTLAVVGPSGRRLGMQVVRTNGADLIEAIKKIRGAIRLCMEEGTQSSWLYEILRPMVEELVVVAVTNPNRGNKNDVEDAFGLAEMLRVGSVGKRVFKYVGKFRKLRSLMRSHGFMTQDVVRSCNRVKAAYRSQGIPTAGREIYAKDAKDSWLAKLDEDFRVAAGALHDSLSGLETLRREMERAMIAEASRHDAFRLVESVPGIGPIRAAQILSVVVNPARFRTKRQFWKYCGLGIVSHSSSDWVQLPSGDWTKKKVQQTRGLNQDHNHILKNVFKGAAMTVLRAPEGPLYADYERMLKAGTKPNLAALTIARKIAAIVLAVWKSKKPYDPTYVKPKVKTSLEGKTDRPHDDKALKT